MENSNPMLSVFLVTYNHEAFIAQAIEGILKQKTNFSYDIIIGEDCSTDNTRAIIRIFEQKYPNIIKPIYYEKNVGMIQNCVEVLKQCKGKYVAFLDGDDYWTDINKLQKQVDFLEVNIDYSICCHDVKSLINNKLRPTYHWNLPETTDQDYLLKHGNQLIPLSVVFRNDTSIATFLAKFPNAPFGDFMMFVAISSYGKIKYLKQNMGVYRMHAGGIWSQQSAVTNSKKYINGLTLLLPHFENQKKQYLISLILSKLEAILILSNTAFEQTYVQDICSTLGINEATYQYILQNATKESRTNKLIKYISAKELRMVIFEKLKLKYWW